MSLAGWPPYDHDCWARWFIEGGKIHSSTGYERRVYIMLSSPSLKEKGKTVTIYRMPFRDAVKRMRASGVIRPRKKPSSRECMAVADPHSVSNAFTCQWCKPFLRKAKRHGTGNAIEDEAFTSQRMGVA
jgi:hypothetical protein